MAAEEERQEEGEAPPHPGLEPFCGEEERERESTCCTCLKKKPHGLSAPQADLKLLGSSNPPQFSQPSSGDLIWSATPSLTRCNCVYCKVQTRKPGIPERRVKAQHGGSRTP